MDYSKFRSTAPRRRVATGPSNDVKACALTLNKLTLATLVIAVVGFAGTAFAAAPIDCAVQAPAAVSSTR